MALRLFSSESVTEGHPDKIADQISDSILDHLLAEDGESRVACETLVTTGLALVSGEITTSGYADIPEIVRNTLRRIGYTNSAYGIDSDTCAVLTSIDRQSPDIAQGVDTGGAGDQGMMRRISTVVVSAQHDPDATQDQIREEIIEKVVTPVLPAELLDPDHCTFHINPTGRFEIGGPHGDAGLTGRKVIVDTYGGAGRHGGGAFSGKDATKVDRSAAYAARWAARTVVSAGAARRCEIQLAYAIGVVEPVSVYVDTFGTGVVDDARIAEAVQEVFDFRPLAIIDALDLRTPIYRPTAAYGHFGRTPANAEAPGGRTVRLFPWEADDRVDELESALEG